MPDRLEVERARIRNRLFRERALQARRQAARLHATAPEIEQQLLEEAEQWERMGDFTADAYLVPGLTITDVGKTIEVPAVAAPEDPGIDEDLPLTESELRYAWGDK